MITLVLARKSFNTNLIPFNFFCIDLFILKLKIHLLKLLFSALLLPLIRFGAIPANVIMASNSLPNKKRLFILQTLTNVTLVEALHVGKYGAGPLLSPR